MMEKLKDKTYLFLRNAQKYTGTDNIYLAKGGTWLFFGEAITIGVSIVSGLAFANLLDPAVYGKYRYILSLAGWLSVLSLPGIESAVNQAAAKGLEGSFYTGFKTKLKWGVLGSLGALGFAAYYWIRGNHEIAIPLLIAAAFLPLMQASQVYGSFLTGKKLFNAEVKYTTLAQIISTAASILILFTVKNVFWLIASYFISRTLLNYFFYLLTRFRFNPNKKEDRQTISFGKHLSIMKTLSIGAGYLTEMLLFNLAGAQQLAIYYFAANIPGMLKTFMEKVNILALPKFSTRTRQEIKKGMISKLKKLYLLIGATIVCYVLSAPYVFKIFFPQYLNSVPYSQAYIFSLLSLPANLIITAFTAHMMKKELYLQQTILPISGIILLVALIPPFGVWGVIGATLISSAVNLTLVLFLFIKKF
jgi:O-antigen/teichoic acid export membrane protein